MNCRILFQEKKIRAEEFQIQQYTRSIANIREKLAARNYHHDRPTARRKNLFPSSRKAAIPNPKIARQDIEQRRSFSPVAEHSVIQ
jgi:hypothetical protein